MANETEFGSKKPAASPQVIETDNDARQSRESKSTLAHKKSGVCFALDFRKNNSIMRRRKSKRRKEYERQRREKLKHVREQRARNLKAVRYSKEMRNRDNIRKQALIHRNEVLSTPSTYDDKFIEQALHPERRFDKLIYNTNPSDVADEFDDIFDDVICDTD